MLLFFDTTTSYEVYVCKALLLTIIYHK